MATGYGVARRPAQPGGIAAAQNAGHYHSEARARPSGELDKDLTGHPIDKIEAALQAA